MPKNAKIVENEFSDENWKVVSEPRTKGTFDTIGDKMVGTWVGFEDIIRPDTQEVMKYANFDDARIPDENGEVIEIPKFTVSASYQLIKDLEDISHGTRTMLEYISDTPVRQGNPLKNFRVSVR